MPARDLYHQTVREALVKDGWTITHDPLTLQVGKKDLFVDLGAEKLLAAQKGERKIAVEVKSFLGKSEMADLEAALGQFVLYHHVLDIREPDRDLFLAIREVVYNDIFEEPIGQILLERNLLRLVLFDSETKEIVRWIPSTTFDE